MMHRLTLLAVCLVCCCRAEEPATDPLLRLPVLPVVRPVAAADHGEATTVAPGILTTPSAVILEGVSLIDTGPVDGLEVIACLVGGKNHEALMRLTTSNAQLVKFAMIRVLGCDDGVPAIESSGQPARGVPVRLLLEWADPDHPGHWLAIDASCLVRDRVTDKPYPPLPYIYTGSRIVAVPETQPDGKVVKRERFMLDITKSVAVNYDEPDSLLASPFPVATVDQRFEANSAFTPPPGTPMRLVATQVKIPLELTMTASGSLHAQAGGPALDDGAIQALLAQQYGGSATPNVRAVGVRVADPATDRAVDVAVRTRLLALAAAAQAWVVPVFIPAAATP